MCVKMEGNHGSMVYVGRWRGIMAALLEDGGSSWWSCVSGKMEGHGVL